MLAGLKSSDTQERRDHAVAVKILAADMAIGLSKGLLYDMDTAMLQYRSITSNLYDHPLEVHSSALEAELRTRLAHEALFIAVQSSATLIAPARTSVRGSTLQRDAMSFGVEPGGALADDNPNVVRIALQ